MRVPMGLRIPPSLDYDTLMSGMSPRQYVSTLDVYPTLARLANITLSDWTSEGLEGTDLFQEDTDETSDLEEALAGTTLEGSYPQLVYPLVEDDSGESECLVAEGLRYIRFLTNSTGRGQWRGNDEKNLYHIPTEVDSPYHCNFTEAHRGNLYHHHSDAEDVLDKYIHDQRAALSIFVEADDERR